MMFYQVCTVINFCRFICRSASPLNSRGLNSAANHQVDLSYQFVVCGAGAGGLAVSSILGRRFGPGKVGIIDPADVGVK